jgi:hypothetical protein
VPRSKKKKDKREVMVVPIKEETFASTKKIHVYAVPIVRSTSDAEYIAFYRGAPTSAITHYAKVRDISKNLTFTEVFPRGSDTVGKEQKPLKVYHLEALEELSRRVKKGRNPPVSGPRYTKLATLEKARYLDEVWPPDKDKKTKAKKDAPKVAKGKKEKTPAKDVSKKKGGRKKRGKKEPEPAPEPETPKKSRKKRASKMVDKKEPESARPSVHYIVDGSNVALEARTFKEGGRLEQIELVMDKLTEKKGAAVTVLVDANLRHHIDRKDDLEVMIKQRKVLQAPAQTDADEFILLTAESHRSRGENVVIISNDRYLDYIKKYKPRFDWVKTSHKQFMFVFSHDGKEVLEAMISIA